MSHHHKHEHEEHHEEDTLKKILHEEKETNRELKEIARLLRQKGDKAQSATLSITPQ